MPDDAPPRTPGQKRAIEHAIWRANKQNVATNQLFILRHANGPKTLLCQRVSKKREQKEGSHGNKPKKGAR